MTDTTDLAALLSARICHDLISPIGAIGNGVELLMMEGGTPSPELALIAESVAAASARIRFFRIAFGVSGGEQRLCRAEIVKILADTSQGSRLSIDWQPSTDVGRAEAKLAFLAIQCFESALAFGGRISVKLADGKWQASARAERLKIDPRLWDPLSKHTPDLAPAEIQFALFSGEIARQERILVTEITQTEIRLGY